MEIDRMPRLLVGEGWVSIEILSEPQVVYSKRGYMPILHVKTSESEQPRELIISSQSMSNGLEEIRKENGGVFTGIRCALRKASSDKFAQYEIRNETDYITRIADLLSE
jgi:hypothetical protein